MWVVHGDEFSLYTYIDHDDVYELCDLDEITLVVTSCIPSVYRT